MDKNTALKNIRESLKTLLKFSKEIKGEEFGNFELTDGTKLTSTDEDIKVGSEIYQLDDQGNQTPLSDGDYVLSDGRTFTIKSNAITVISDVDAADAPQDETQTPSDNKDTKMADGIPDAEDNKDGSTDDTCKRLDDLEASIAEIINLLNKMGESQNSANETMMSKIKEIGDESGDEPIKTIKKEAFSYSKADAKNKKKEDALAELRSDIEKSRQANNNYRIV